MAYATRTNLENLALAARALEDSTDAEITAALSAASSEADSYLASRYPSLPLLTWPEVLTLHVSGLAAWHLMKGKGFSPEAGTKDPIRQAYEDALAWLKGVASGLVTPPGVSTGSSSSSSSPDVASDEPRGF